MIILVNKYILSQTNDILIRYKELVAKDSYKSEIYKNYNYEKIWGRE